MSESTPLSQQQQQQHGHNKKIKDNRAICQKQCQFYQKKFPDVTYISSTELVDLSKNEVILVDVRTEPERQVSMLEGAITKEQFLQQQQQQQQGNDTASSTTTTNPLIVTYCTVGYRSGLEARRLGLEYPHYKSRIRSLDGYVSYTHALGEALDQNATTTTAAPPTIVNPQTGEPTNQVHTFGWMWGCVDDQNFQATHFNLLELLMRMLQVMMAVVAVTCLRIKSYCSPAPPRRVLLDE